MTFLPFPPSGPAPNLDCPLKVGILGAGVSGLYSALLLQSLGVDYEILEADCRVGGRIFTHYFDPEAWQQATPEDPAYYNYYASRTEYLKLAVVPEMLTRSQDVGAMRIPGMPYMDRVIGAQNWSLVNYVNSHVSNASDAID